MVNIKNIKKRLSYNTSLLFGGKTVSNILVALQEVVLARMLGVELYGLLVLIRAFVDILNALFNFGVWETATKYVGTFLTMDEKDKTVAMIKLSYIVDVSSGIVAFAIAYLSANIAAKYIIKSPESAPLIAIYAFSLLISTSNKTSDAIFRVFDRFKTRIVILTFQNFIRLALIVIILYMGMGIEGVLISFIIASFLGFSMRIWSVNKILSEKEIKKWWRARLSIIKDHFREIIWFLSNTSFNATVRMTADNFLGVLVLGYISGKEAVAYYKVARSVVKVINGIADPLYEAIYPELVSILSLNAINEYKNIVKQAVKNLMKFTAPIAAVIIIFSDLILSLIFGKDYLPASNTVRIITLANIISQPIFWISPSLLAFGRAGLKNLINTSCAIVYIVLLFLLVPIYSYNGAAGAFLGYHVIITIVSLFVIRHVIERESAISQ